MPPPRPAAWETRTIALGVTAAALVALAIASIVLGQWELAVGGASSIIMAALVLLRRPGNRVGMVLFGFGAASVLSEFAIGYSRSVTDGPSWLGRLIPVVGASVFVLVGTTACALLFVFPTGRAPGRWRWALRAVLSIGTIGTLAGAAWGLLTPLGEVRASIVGTSSDNNPADFASAIVFALFSPLSLISAFSRYRRADFLQRAQLRWLVFGAAVLPGTAVVQNILDSFETPVGSLMTALGFVAYPTAIAVAVLRYKLYEIDRIVSRTVSYGVVVACLVGIYGGGVALLSRVFPFEDDIAVAASTLVAAAMFNPIRRRTRRFVDRRFNRQRYDIEEELSTFSDRIQGTTNLIVLQNQVLDVVKRALQPSVSSVWIASDRAPHSGPEGTA